MTPSKKRSTDPSQLGVADGMRGYSGGRCTAGTHVSLRRSVEDQAWTALPAASYHDRAVSKPEEQLDRFYLTRRRCGALTSGLYGDDAVWMSCSCSATILVPAREEGPEYNPDGGSPCEQRP